MNLKEKSQNIDLTVTGSNAPVVILAEPPSQASQIIRPTPPQGSRALHSARSARISCKDHPNEPSIDMSHLSFSAASSARPSQQIPISVILEADLPKISARKQSVIFTRRKEIGILQQRSPRLPTSRGCVEKSLSVEETSKCAASKLSQSFFHVDALSATISPRPPIARARSPTNIQSITPQSPRIARHTVIHDENNAAISESPRSALDSSHLLETSVSSKRIKRRIGSHEAFSLEISDMPEDIQKTSQKNQNASFDDDQTPRMAFSNSHDHTPRMAISRPQIITDISRAQQVSELENRVQDSMNQSQYNNDVRQSIVALASVGVNSTLKFAFPHPSPAQLFIVSQPIIKLTETSIFLQTSKQTASMKLKSSRPHPVKAMNADHSADVKVDLNTLQNKNPSPRHKNTFFVQKDAFVLKNVLRSPRSSLPSRDTQQPILFNHIGPYKHKSSVHDSRAADAAINILAATKPLQTQKTSADHQNNHIMCNNRVPDYFLAAMHRK